MPTVAGGASIDARRVGRVVADPVHLHPARVHPCSGRPGEPEADRVRRTRPLLQASLGHQHGGVHEPRHVVLRDLDRVGVERARPEVQRRARGELGARCAAEVHARLAGAERVLRQHDAAGAAVVAAGRHELPDDVVRRAVAAVLLGPHTRLPAAVPPRSSWPRWWGTSCLRPAARQGPDRASPRRAQPAHRHRARSAPEGREQGRAVHGRETLPVPRSNARNGSATAMGCSAHADAEGAS